MRNFGMYGMKIEKAEQKCILNQQTVIIVVCTNQTTTKSKIKMPISGVRNKRYTSTKPAWKVRNSTMQGTGTPYKLLTKQS